MCSRHRARSYRFDHADPADWIAQHFFTGGIMPAHDLPHRFGDCSRSSKNGAGRARTIAAPRCDWLGEHRRGQRACRRSWRACTARTQNCGGGAGGCSSWRRRGCSATPAAPNGASAIIGSRRSRAESGADSRPGRPARRRLPHGRLADRRQQAGLSALCLVVRRLRHAGLHADGAEPAAVAGLGVVRAARFRSGCACAFRCSARSTPCWRQNCLARPG